ncbi:Glypican-5 [Frankliniella fusca]|uniref:Glypican-5 n=1 Tax=Frankliniella fusca TaxID=407009 RepID=A0AAE1GUW6_9NEOP|nr:Glypican-5 [Frankliniella fusca]
MRAACGPVRWADAEAVVPMPAPLPLPAPVAAAALEVAVGAPGPGASGASGAASPAGAARFAARLRELQASLNRSRGFYADLPDVLCADKDTAAHDAQACWNGQKVDVYTNRVFTDRKYNLELGPRASDRPLPAHLRNVVAKLDDLGTLMGQLARRVQRPVQADSMTDDSHYGRGGAGAGAGGRTQSEEAEVEEGSGGGRHAGHYPDRYPTDDEDMEGSGAAGERGSGDGDVDLLSPEPPRSSDSAPPQQPSRGDGDTGGAAAAAAHWSAAISLCATVLTVLRLRLVQL